MACSQDRPEASIVSILLISEVCQGLLWRLEILPGSICPPSDRNCAQNSLATAWRCNKIIEKLYDNFGHSSKWELSEE